MSDVNRTDEKFYADRDVIKQGQVYVNHVLHMTSEALHSKSDIAAELAHRDIELTRLQEKVKQLEGENAHIKEHARPIVKDALQQRNTTWAENEQLKAECERLRVDAARYQWLRQLNIDSYLACGKLEKLDSAIDEQINQSNKG